MNRLFLPLASGLLAAVLCFGAPVPARASFATADVVSVTKEKTHTDTIAVPDMQCGMCEKRISKTLKKIEGVKGVRADAEIKQVIVDYDASRVTRQRIEEAIAGIGYDAGAARATVEARKSLPSCCLPSDK